MAAKKERVRRPRSPATHRGRPENFVGEEAPEARVGPRNPDAFYRGEEAGAAIKTIPINHEIEKIIGHIRQQPKYPKRVLPAEKGEVVMGPDDVAMGFSNDNFFDEAAKLVVRHQQGSISLLQRRLKVGYARAARLIDELETAGVEMAGRGRKASRKGGLFCDQSILSNCSANTRKSAKSTCQAGKVDHVNPIYL